MTNDERTINPEWNSEDEFFSLIRNELYTSVVGDICDQIGLRNQFLPPDLRPLDQSKRNVLVGRAMTVLEEDVSESLSDSEPWGKMLEALDNLDRNDIYVCSGSIAPYALFGELMSTAALKRGATGAVCNGFVRDTHQILALEFPVYCRGSYALDQRGRGTVRDYRVPLFLGEVRINSGDLVIGDVDGAIVLPREREVEITTKSLTKARTESVVRAELVKGMSASEAFARYGVL